MTPQTIEAIPQAPPEDERDERRPRWELVECTCPDWCERDHELD